MNKKISNKTLIITIIAIAIVAILYFLFFVVDIVTYIKNYSWLKEAGVQAEELHNDIEKFSDEFDANRKEHEEKMQNIRNTYGYDY